MNEIPCITFSDTRWQQSPILNSPFVVEIASPCPPDDLVRQLAAREGPLDVYCWYIGNQGLPQIGAQFMKRLILQPLYESKRDAKVYLYALNGWDFAKTVDKMTISTRLGDAINRINTVAVECLYASAFFRYCAQVAPDSRLYTWIQENLPVKEWLLELSADRFPKGMTVSEFFNNNCSLFDCIGALDVKYAYSFMQYVEGYYLIQESVRKGLAEGRTNIQIAFALPNNEGMYYRDLPQDIEQMLQADFGGDLAGVTVSISFLPFQYEASPDDRPYIDMSKKALKVGVKDIPSYFDFLIQQDKARMPFLRDAIHNLNGWY